MCNILRYLSSVHITARTAIDDYYLFHYCHVVFLDVIYRYFILRFNFTDLIN